MSQVKVIRQRFNGKRWYEVTRFGRGMTDTTAFVRQGGDQYRASGVVTSTGGPRAVQILLSPLGRGFPLPIVLVQRVTPSFHFGFVSWLNRTSPQSVAQCSSLPLESKDPEILQLVGRIAEIRA